MELPLNSQQDLKPIIMLDYLNSEIVSKRLRKSMIVFLRFCQNITIRESRDRKKSEKLSEKIMATNTGTNTPPKGMIESNVPRPI